MTEQTDRKIILITRRTRLDELVARFNTQSQAKFYVEHSGADFSDYQREHETYRAAVAAVEESLRRFGRLQTLDRTFLPNFLFGDDDLVVVVGQDGLVANTIKYLDGQPVLAVNPDRTRWDGVLLPFVATDVDKIIREVAAEKRQYKEITMAKAALNNGQILYGVNDLFVGPKSHTSARYLIEQGERKEKHSSSGIIISTGLGSTGWFKSLMAGASAIANELLRTGSVKTAGKKSSKSSVNEKSSVSAATGVSAESDGAGSMMESSTAGAAQKVEVEPQPNFAWNSDYLYFTVREPFPSKASAATLVFGKVTSNSPLKIVSQMPEHGVIFSDGIESDFLEFNSGTEAAISLAEKRGRLVV